MLLLGFWGSNAFNILNSTLFYFYGTDAVFSLAVTVTGRSPTSPLTGLVELSVSVVCGSRSVILFTVSLEWHNFSRKRN